MRSLKILLVFLLISLFNFKAFAQIPLSDKANISLLTCGPGDELYSIFGHTAIRVQDPESNIDTVYNFGTFDFDTPNFYLKFVKGDLQYFVSVSSYKDFVYQYVYYNRDVFEQTLNLTHFQKQKIADELNTMLLTDKRFYTYKFIERNCTTMVADILNKHAVKISHKNSDSGKTYRQILYSYLDEGHFYENLGISLIFGKKTDSTLSTPFLPIELMESVNNTKTANGPYAQPVLTINKQQKKDSGFSFWNSYYSYLLAIALILIFSGKRIVCLSFLTISGLFGILFCIVAIYSTHSELTLNYNALLLNPFALVLVYFLLTNNTKWIIRLTYSFLAFLIFYTIIVASKPYFLSAFPLIVLMAAIYTRLLIKARKTTL